ncbi:MAG: FxsA family protein [Actinobacteria bacterium]|nr:FxsA family protein [Actinomycetota bacterium]
MRLLVLAAVLAIVEFYVIVKVGEAIGPWWTLLALVGTSMLGVRLVRSQGRAVLRDFAGAIAAGRPPAREGLDGVLVFVGGALLIVPGFVTDVLGALLLAPPTRSLIRGQIIRHYASRLVAHLARAGAGRPGAGSRTPTAQVYDVDGRAIEVDPDKLPR